MGKTQNYSIYFKIFFEINLKIYEKYIFFINEAMRFFHIFE